MKRKSIFVFISVVALCLLFLCINLRSYSQDEIAMAASLRPQAAMDLPKAELRQTMNDTILPTINNSGHGLLHYDCAYFTGEDKKCGHPKVHSISSTVIMENLSESEIKCLLENERFMERESVNEIQQQIRKDKMDLQLGEIIKGFYMQPVD
jgi:hypothetical protein